MATENQAAQIQRLRELAIWMAGLRALEVEGATVIDHSGNPITETGHKNVAECIALAMNLAQPLLDAWEERDSLVADLETACSEHGFPVAPDEWEQGVLQGVSVLLDQVHRDIDEYRTERDAALERERVLVAEVAKLQDLIRLRLVDDELFLYDHPEEETIFIREWTDDAHQALTPETSPCKDWRHTTSLLTGVWTLEDGTKKDFGPQHIIACPTCQPAGSEYLVFCGGCGFKHKSGYADCVYKKEI